MQGRNNTIRAQMEITIPKSQLPECAVGETVEMRITGEDDKNFTLSPYEKDEEPKKPAKAKAPKKGSKRPKAIDKVLDEDGDGY